MASRSATASPKAGRVAIHFGSSEAEARRKLAAAKFVALQARVGGALCLPVPRSSPPLCGDHAAVDVNRRPGSGQVVMVAGVLVTHWLHECKVARVR